MKKENKLFRVDNKIEYKEKNVNDIIKIIYPRDLKEKLNEIELELRSYLQSEKEFEKSQIQYNIDLTEIQNDSNHFKDISEKYKISLNEALSNNKVLLKEAEEQLSSSNALRDGIHYMRYHYNAALQEVVDNVLKQRDQHNDELLALQNSNSELVSANSELQNKIFELERRNTELELELWKSSLNSE